MTYIGVINNLRRRLIEHIQGKNEGYTKKFNLNKLVYYEIYNDPYFSIKREKQLKGWKKEKKFSLIESKNPDFEDLGKYILYSSR